MSDYDENLEEIILDICTVPLSNFVATELFYNCEFRSMHHDLFRVCTELAHLKFFNMSLRGYMDFYEKRLSVAASLPHWSSTSLEMFKREYMSLSKSKLILYRLLIFQCVDDHEKYTYVPGDEIHVEFRQNIDDNLEIYNWHESVFSFVRNLILLLDKRRGAKNCDLYIGSSNSGVNMFVNLITDFMISFGNINSWKSSTFPMYNCRYPRLLLFDEPEFLSSTLPQLHKLLSGQAFDTILMRDNHPEAVRILRTPVIITSQYEQVKLKNIPLLKDHITRHVWKDASHIINDDVLYKRLHPMAFHQLIKDCENMYQEIIESF